MYNADYYVIDNIKIYDGTTIDSKKEYKKRIEYLKEINKDTENLFSPLEPSTLTAQGQMSNISFIEEDLIDMLSKPPKYILKIGCNYGELFHEDYKEPVKKEPSGRGRKPKIKKKSKRKVQGTGKYFSSQITFEIQHPDTEQIYKIKLFRNGVFQAPGVKNPLMTDLIKPIEILRQYLEYNFGEDVQVLKFMAVMRNYKSKLLNKYLHIDLEKLEEIILKEKVNKKYDEFVEYMLENINKNSAEIIKKRLGTYNPMSIAEMTYNTDRCVCLIIKFYRPNLQDPTKKTTVKLLKKGKINFDGGNSELEVLELYHWLRYIYNKYKDKIMFDIRKITTELDSDTSDCSNESIYSENSESDSEND